MKKEGLVLCRKLQIFLGFIGICAALAGDLVLAVGSESAALPPDSSSAEEDQGASKKRKQDKPTTGSDSQKFSFDEILVQGRFNSNDVAITTVEEDKVLDALLGVRKHFNDRIEESVEQW